MQNLREENGEHTCDMRSTRTIIAQKFPPPIYVFEEGFAEADVLWKADERETKEHVARRAQAVLDRIFTVDNETCAGFCYSFTVFQTLTVSDQISVSRPIVAY